MSNFNSRRDLSGWIRGESEDYDVNNYMQTYVHPANIETKEYDRSFDGDYIVTLLSDNTGNLSFQTMGEPDEDGKTRTIQVFISGENGRKTLIEAFEQIVSVLKTIPNHDGTHYGNYKSSKIDSVALDVRAVLSNQDYIMQKIEQIEDDLYYEESEGCEDSVDCPKCEDLPF